MPNFDNNDGCRIAKQHLECATSARPNRVAGQITIGRIVLALVVVATLDVLFHYQLHGDHSPSATLAVIPVAIFSLFCLRYVIRKLIGALYPTRRWLRSLAWPLGFLGLVVLWWNQPYFGANVCLLKGFMRETDFVEAVRPTIRTIANRRGVELGSELPAGVTVAQFAAVADEAVDLLKQCAAERDVNYCRYAGPNPGGLMMHARTNDGPNAIAPEDEHKYRYLKAGLDYEISMIQTDVSGSWLSLKVWRFGKPLGAGGMLCYLGCWCNEEYGR